MNDNGLPSDPLSAAQFNRPALIRTSIPLNVNRTLGEFFPNVSGNFLRIDACDYLCRISFNNGDFDQAIPVVPGMTIDGDYSGITLWHDDLSATTAIVSPRLSLVIGRNTRAEVDSYGAFSALPVPYAITSATTVASIAECAVPYGARQAKWSATFLWGNPTTVFAGLVETRAIHLPAGTNVLGTITRNGVAFNTTQNRLLTSWVAPVQSAAAQWAISASGVTDIGPGAERLRISHIISAAAATNDGMQWSVTFR